MLFMVPKRSPKLGIDNEKLTLKDFAIKLKEETEEVVQAVEEKNKNHIAEETLDTIQICVNILDKLQDKGLNINQALNKHHKKLRKRGWQAKRMIIFQIFNWY